jgi:Ca2+-binding EF-hand superfamily protein
MKYYDKNGDGSISFNEFIGGLRELLNDRRKKIVRKAFSSLSRDGHIKPDEFSSRFDASSFPEFKSGKKSKDQIAHEVFQSMDTNHSGRVSKPEFYSYYADVSLTFTRDEDFVSHVESVWTVSEDDDSKVF